MDYITAIISRYEEDLQMVKQNGWLLEIVKEQTPEICLAAVKETGLVLKFVREQTYEICLEAVKQYESVLEYINDPLLKAQIKLELKL